MALEQDTGAGFCRCIVRKYRSQLLWGLCTIFFLGHWGVECRMLNLDGTSSCKLFTHIPLAFDGSRNRANLRLTSEREGTDIIVLVVSEAMDPFTDAGTLNLYIFNKKCSMTSSLYVYRPP